MQIAAHTAAGGQPSARAGPEQSQIGRVEREIQVERGAGAAVELDVGGAQLQPHVVEQPVAAAVRDLCVAGSALATQCARQVAQVGVEIAVGVVAASGRGQAETEPSGDARTQLRDIQVIDVATQLPGRRGRPAQLAGQL